jgi:multicomponent K+:H+ antiporter subunit D
MGLNGAFLTGDLFNLFVFFEILLAASYGLLLHGSGVARVVPGLHYIVINLAASLLFLIGVSIVFGVTGTLNMAVLAERIGGLEDGTRALLHAGAAILGVAFLVKAAAWPLGFWLPRTYAAAVPAAAAMFAIMTKVGIYAILRLSTLLFGPAAGASAAFGTEWLFIAGGVTIAVGIVGMLAAGDLARMTGSSLLISSGTLLAVVALQNPQVLAGGLFYMAVSTAAAAALYLLAGMITPDGTEAIDEPPVLEAYDPEADGLFTEDDERTVRIPAPIGILSGGFLIAALMISGLPPLPGFLAKFAMLSPLLEAPAGPFPWAPWVLAVLVILSSLFPLIGLARSGIQIWWADERSVPPTIRLGEVAPVTLLLLACIALTFVVEGPFGFIQRTATQLLSPAQYIEAVLGAVKRP